MYKANPIAPLGPSPAAATSGASSAQLSSLHRYGPHTEAILYQVPFYWAGPWVTRMPTPQVVSLGGPGVLPGGCCSNQHGSLPLCPVSVSSPLWPPPLLF